MPRRSSGPVSFQLKLEEIPAWMDGKKPLTPLLIKSGFLPSPSLHAIQTSLQIEDIINPHNIGLQHTQSLGCIIKMSEYNLLVQRIGFITIMNALSNLGGLILLPILTKSMPAEDYGVWAQVNVTVGLVSIVVLLGLPHSMVRFMAASHEEEAIQESFYSIFLLVALFGIIVSILILQFSSFLAELLFGGDLTVTMLLAPIIVLESLNALFFAFYRTAQRIKLYSLFVFLSMYLAVALAYYFVSVGEGINGAVFGLLISKAVLFIIMLYLVLAEIGFRVPRFLRLHEYLSFSLPLIPSGLSDWVINSSDRYVISIFLGTTYVGYYSPGYLLGNTITMIINPIGTILPVVLAKHYDENNMDVVETVLNCSLKYFLALAIPSLFGLTILSYPLLLVLSTPEMAENGYLITPFVALSMLLFGSSSILANVIALVKRTTISASISFLAAAANLGLTLILVPRMGIIGAALATLLAFCMVFAITAHYAVRFLSFRIDYAFLAKCLLSSLIMSLALILWSPESILQIAASVIFCAIIYFIVLFFLGGIGKEELEFFKDMLRK
jgi:O-antigen/teichoic acid export membrane protein